MNKLILLFLLVNLQYSLFAQNFDSLLLKLDETIAESNFYIEKRENRITNLKKKLSKVSPNTIAAYDINLQLFNEYEPYICDSAIAYQNKNITIAQKLHDIKREYESEIQHAYLLGSIGLYKEASDLLESINRSKLPDSLLVDYYNAHLRVYGEIAFYTQDKVNSAKYWSILGTYSDSLKLVIDHKSQMYFQMQEDSVRDARNFDYALKLNDTWISRTQPGTPEYALATFHRSLIYLWMGDRENHKYYLILSAIADIQSAIKDQASLRMLAQILYEEEKIDRAYNYIRFSWNATVFYNARLRNLQTSSILSLIDKTYQVKLENQKSKLQFYLILISTLFVLLAFTVLIIYKQISKLSLAKKNLQLANDNLNKLNSELNNLNDELKELNLVLNNTNNNLSESNKIKELYIGRFIELCSIYINKIDDFRKKVNKKIKDGKIDEAKLLTQSQDIMDDEYEELYVNFDSAFLQLFPDFVEKVNELFNGTDKLVLKKGELLNPELRIIALIRLGISDGAKISLFLRYSLTTVYNYRTKTKNRTYLPKEDFDNRILLIQ